MQDVTTFTRNNSTLIIKMRISNLHKDMTRNHTCALIISFTPHFKYKYHNYITPILKNLRIVYLCHTDAPTREWKVPGGEALSAPLRRAVTFTINSLLIFIKLFFK